MDMNDTLIKKAADFATKAHEGQVEKDIAKTPYILHSKKVAELVALSGGSKEEIASAWLHDVVEDTPIIIEIIEQEFNSEIAKIVKGLTDLPSFSELSVEQRKQKQADHIAMENDSVRRVKLADQISAIELDGYNTLLDSDHRIAYLKGAKKIADKCKGISPFLDDLFTETYNKTMEFIINN
jgi:(p)ppGpp synthase/HD superfamily hydrolase